MLKQLAIKKEYLLIGAGLVLLLLCYQLAFKKTVEAWQVNKQLKSRLSEAADLCVQPAYLERKNSNLEKIIARYQTDTANFRSNRISDLSVIAEKENVKLSDVPLEDPQYHTDKFIIQKLSFEGDFFALTKVLNQLHSTTGMGMIRSATYKVDALRQQSGESRKLVLDVYLESVKK